MDSFQINKSILFAFTSGCFCILFIQYSMSAFDIRSDVTADYVIDEISCKPTTLDTTVDRRIYSADLTTDGTAHRKSSDLQDVLYKREQLLIEMSKSHSPAKTLEVGTYRHAVYPAADPLWMHRGFRSLWTSSIANTSCDCRGKDTIKYKDALQKSSWFSDVSALRRVNQKSLHVEIFITSIS